MFEVAELGHKVSKEEYNALVPELRTQLLEVQEQLKETNFPVLVLISGVDGAGKGATLTLLNEWLDPRYVTSYAFGIPSDEEAERPEYWRFWRALPKRGEMGLYISPWYSRPIAQRVRGEIDDNALDTALRRINTFEQELIDDGALIIKFWLHLSNDGQEKVIKKMSKDPQTKWRVSQLDKEHLEGYDRFRGIAERVLRTTSTGAAPWIIVEGLDTRYRSLTVGQHILDRLKAHLSKADEDTSPHRHFRPIISTSLARDVSILDSLDLGLVVEREEYKRLLKELQGRLSVLSRLAYENKVSSILLFEGWDAGGKGGLIRRMIPAIDPRHYRIIPIAAPTDEERAHHYLWRFWRHIPRAGFTTFYDRTWYGRVLVERVEGFATEVEWMRAYAEITDFEEQLTEHGVVLVKFWAHISKEEQLARFKAREETPFKHYKITDEDWRNREKWDLYVQAVSDMVERTSTEYAPWTLIEGNDKKYARIKALSTYIDRLEAALKAKGVKVNKALKGL